MNTALLWSYYNVCVWCDNRHRFFHVSYCYGHLGFLIHFVRRFSFSAFDARSLNERSELHVVTILRRVLIWKLRLFQSGGDATRKLWHKHFHLHCGSSSLCRREGTGDLLTKKVTRSGKTRDRWGRTRSTDWTPHWATKKKRKNEN